MSKAEDLAKELFPLLETDKIDNNPYITYNTKQLAKQEGFVKGFHQAEKDKELTWEDIKYLDELILYVYKEENLRDDELYKETLKRFKDFKEREGNQL